MLNTGAFQCICLFWELNICLLNTGCLLNRGGHYDRFYCTPSYLELCKYFLAWPLGLFLNVPHENVACGPVSNQLSKVAEKSGNPWAQDACIKELVQFLLLLLFHFFLQLKISESHYKIRRFLESGTVSISQL